MTLKYTSMSLPPDLRNTTLGFWTVYRVKGRAEVHTQYSQVVPSKKTCADEHIALTWQKPERGSRQQGNMELGK